MDLSRFWPYPLFVLSGAAALVFETVYLRQLAWLFGNSATATALVLASFMAGLALGSALLGRLADRFPNPLRLFGLLELGAAVAGTLLVLLLGPGRQGLIAPLRALDSGPLQRTVELGLAFGLVLVPSMLMGGTLPALTRAVVRDLARLAGSLGWLYGLNTLGAAAGVFLTGFVLFEKVGVSRSAFAAAAVQVGVGVAAILLSRGRGVDTSRQPPRRRTQQDAPGNLPPRLRAACLAAATVGGFAMLGYEVVWTRLLSLFMRSFSYSFALMLALFLLGLCLGATLLALLAPRIRTPVAWLGAILILIGLWVAGSLVWMPERLTRISEAGFVEFFVTAARRAAWIVLPPTILSGMALPLAARGFAGSLDRVGADVGRVYAFNTLGAIAGALGSGLILLPRIGTVNTLAALAALNALAGVALLAWTAQPRTRVILGAVLALGCLVPLVRGSEPFVRAFLAASPGADSMGEMLFYHEGATDTVAIVKREYGFFDPQAKSLITNGFAMAATVKPVWRYMSAEGHLPVLFHRAPLRALAVGVGTGITLSAVASHADIESITAVELSEGVVEGLAQFRHENGGVYEDPRVRLVRDDGRHWMELNEERFDVITLEPPPPIVAGSVHLYSLDFYELCLRRLTAGGVVAQWLPLHAQSEASARMTARTFLAAFPHVTLWLPSVRDAVLIGSRDPLVLDPERVRRAWTDPATRDNLQSAYLETPQALLATFLLDREGIAAWAADAPVITDERPWMEFFMHQGGNMDDADIAPLLAVPQSPFDWLAAFPEPFRAAVRRESAALRGYVAATVYRRPQQGLAAARDSRATEFFLYPHGCTTLQLGELRSGRHEVRPDELEARLARCARLRSAAAPG